MARKPRFTWPPSGDEKKQFHAEVAAPAAILQALGADIEVGRSEGSGTALGATAEALEEWLRARASGMGGLVAGGARSWNQPQLIMAARGLVFGDWGDAAELMAMQAGRIPGQGAAQWLDGEEPRSTDYDPFRWAAELVFASDRAPAEMRADAREVLRRQLGLALLGAVQWTDQGDDFRNARGELWYRGPTLSPVGERSPKTSNPDQVGLFCRFALGAADLCDREGFAGAVADLVGADLLIEPQILSPFDDPNLALKLLGTAKVFGEFRFVEYPEGRLTYRPKQLNPNTPSALWSWADHATRRQTRGFPFDPSLKNRGEGAPRSVGCGIEDGEIVARSTDDKWTARFKLPTSTPLWSIVVDEQGARFESGGGPVPKPVDPPVDPPPPTPEIDLEALVAAVIALGAQDDQTLPAVALVRAEQWQKASEAVAGMMVPIRNQTLRDELAVRLGKLAVDG